MSNGDVTATVKLVASAGDWNDRVSLIRRIPEWYGTARHAEVYSAVAQAAYVPNLAPDFAYVPTRPEYELEIVEKAYDEAYAATTGFQAVETADIERALLAAPRSMLIFRLLVAYRAEELAAASRLIADVTGLQPAPVSAVDSMEAGRPPRPAAARVLAEVISRAMAGHLFPAPDTNLRSKVDRPDTAEGWTSVRRFAQVGVPFATFLHQRHYGGAFRQILDATSSQRGNLLEDAVETLFRDHGIHYVRTGGSNQADIERVFGITVRPAPDFVAYSFSGTREEARAMLECKGANDGGTARDKAARFRNLSQEGGRLGGVPVFAVLSGLGWTRTRDALGPVVQATDGRVFMLPNLTEMLTVDPFPGLVEAGA